MSTAPRVSDAAGWGYSLANLAEILFGCLDAIGARSVIEVGAYKGELTRELLRWAAGSGAGITAIDPDPPPELLELGEEHPELELVLETSHDALPRIPLPDAVIIDGDHNHYTVSEELRLIAERTAQHPGAEQAPGNVLPLVMFHDVCWPHGRRDSYSAPERIPEDHRQPLAHDTTLVPWDPGVVEGGLPFEWAAEREGGPRNGVLTAIEDFTTARGGLRLATVPAFFGFGVLWHRDAPWASAVAAVVEPLDRNPVLERLEANRVAHLAARYGLKRDLDQALERLAECRRRLAEQESLLRAMLGSRAFALAERASRLRQGGAPVFSRERVRRVLGDDDGSG